jgi:hypothetical protein
MTGRSWRVTVARDSGFGNDRRSRHRSCRGGPCGADDVRGGANASRDRQAGRPAIRRSTDLASRLRPSVRGDDAGEQKSISGVEGDYCLRLSRPIGPASGYPRVGNRRGFSGRSDTRQWGLLRCSRQHAGRTVQGPFGRALSEVVGAHVLTLTVMLDLCCSGRCVEFAENSLGTSGVCDRGVRPLLDRVGAHLPVESSRRRTWLGRTTSVAGPGGPCRGHQRICVVLPEIPRRVSRTRAAKTPSILLAVEGDDRRSCTGRGGSTRRCTGTMSGTRLSER